MGTYLPGGEPAMTTVDWRTQLTPDVRGGIVDKITETLRKHLPFSGPEGLNELRRIATSFEDRILRTALNQTDYLRKISTKLLIMEPKAQVTAASSVTSLPAANFYTSLEPGHLMDNNNLGASLPKEEPAIDTNDWRTQLPPDSRHKIVNKLMGTLKKHLPFSGSEGLSEVRRIAARFEEKTFDGAVNQTDYLRKISMKMLTMETKSQNAAGSSPCIPAVNNSIPLNPGHHLDNVNSMPSLPKVEPAVYTDDWRTQLPPDSRQKNANEIMETLKKHVPNCGQEGIRELTRMAVSFEELIFKTAINQMDYVRKVSFKMQIMEESDSRPQKKMKKESH